MNIVTHHVAMIIEIKQAKAVLMSVEEVEFVLGVGSLQNESVIVKSYVLWIAMFQIRGQGNRGLLFLELRWLKILDGC